MIDFFKNLFNLNEIVKQQELINSKLNAIDNKLNELLLEFEKLQKYKTEFEILKSNCLNLIENLKKKDIDSYEDLYEDLYEDPYDLYDPYDSYVRNQVPTNINKKFELYYSSYYKLDTFKDGDKILNSKLILNYFDETENTGCLVFDKKISLDEFKYNYPNIKIIFVNEY